VNNHQRQMLCGSICPSIPRFGEKNHCIFGTAKKNHVLMVKPARSTQEKQDVQPIWL
jgi:hypothetical protein